jgi:TetR/AcrR family transcriptional regulator, transcriptional repressor for nem operon
LAAIATNSGRSGFWDQHQEHEIVKVTKEQSAENRLSLIRAASKLFKERGIDGVGVADISKEAGLTHGALYAQFSSKDELAAAALADGLERSRARILARLKGRAPTVGDFLDGYLSKKHRDDLVGGCAAAASGSEVARGDEALSHSFAQGVARMVDAFERSIVASGLSASRRELALTMVAAEIGAIVLARGIAKSDMRFSDEFIAATHTVLGEIAGEKPHPAARTRRPLSQTKRKTR